jgi:hypothetical protein
VWTFGHAVREIERSHDYVVVEESATKGAVILFGAFAVLDPFIFRNAVGGAFAVGVVLSIFFAMLTFYAAIASSFVANRSRGVLIVRRRIGALALEKVYGASTIDRIFVRVTIKGNGLAVRFKSGRSKGLTMSLGSGDNLENAAAALNQFLYTLHRG